MRKSRIVLLALNLTAIWLGAFLAQGGTPGVNFTLLASFNGTNNGANPYTPPLLGADENLYGSLPAGGTNSAGVIYQASTNASQNTLFTFGVTNGSEPFGSLISGRDGNFYGVTATGGSNSDGTIFEITTNGVFTLLYTFGMVTNTQGYALDGSSPEAGLVQGRDGNFYGVTYSGGGNNAGTVFQFQTNGTLTTLHSFTGNVTNDDGANPYLGPLVEGADGVFYGTTVVGGTNNDGTVYRITAGGTITTLFEFNSTNGLNPYAGLSFGNDGNLYGTTVYGGLHGYGTAFQITTNGALTTLFQFGGTDGLYYPVGGLIPGNNDTLFGTTYEGGPDQYGSVFQLSTNGGLTVLYSFSNTGDGANPYAGVIRDVNGNLYGATKFGGLAGGYGTVYRVTFLTLNSVLSPTNGQVLSESGLTVAGTASDNAAGGAITNVFYSFNGAAWTSATTTNEWINWGANLTLVPGTNTIASYAVDALGNTSATNDVSFDYVPGAVLTVSTNGVGTLSTNYNGSILALGQSYVITAKAGTGFVFSNWTGGTSLPLTFLTNGVALHFVMVSNLMLQANFADLTRPTLSITNLTAGQQVSNDTFTVRGKAANNWRLANVFYSLNTGAWTNAASTNSFTNWSATVSLVPGTNTIAAYAVDSTGLASLTNSLTFDYVSTTPLTVTTNRYGFGTLSPNDNGVLLRVGTRYSITATAGTGFTFTNWTGGISGTDVPLTFLTNGATVTFVMQTNLALQANFIDSTKPTVSITNLAANQQWSNAQFTVMGKAWDNVAIAGVLYKLDSQGWSNATPGIVSSNWSAAVTLTPGSNTIAVYAVDSGGNLSATNALSFNYVVSAPLTVTTNGLGTLSPNDNGVLLQVGTKYSITATAKTGFLFTNWTGGTGLPLTFLTNGATVTFVMQSNLMLRANFKETSSPLLTITRPANNQRMTNALAYVAGTVSDNWKVANVLYQLNSNDWRQVATTNSYTNWTQTIALVAGTNTFKAYAVNLGGNLSATNQVNVYSTNAFKLQLAVSNGVTASGLTLQLDLSPGMNGHIQASTNLMDWTTLTNFTGTNAVLNIMDPSITNQNHKFYRAVVP